MGVSRRHIAAATAAVTRPILNDLCMDRRLLKRYRTTLVKCAAKIAASALFFVLGLQAATLEYLSLDDMALKSTAIVRARITGSYASAGRSLIYTHYRIEVLDRWKGPGSSEMDIVLPGGSANGRRQTFPGTPTLTPGSEYLLFLWESPKSGLTHVVGLSQGVFTLTRGDNGEVTAYRGPNTETMLDSAGKHVRQPAMSLNLGDFHQRVGHALETATK